MTTNFILLLEREVFLLLGFKDFQHPKSRVEKSHLSHDPFSKFVGFQLSANIDQHMCNGTVFGMTVDVLVFSFDCIFVHCHY